MSADVNSLANLLLPISLVPVVLYLLLLVARSDWRKEYATQAAVFASLGLALVLAQNTASVYLSTDYSGRPWLRFGVYLGLTLGWIAMLIALLHYQRKKGR